MLWGVQEQHEGAKDVAIAAAQKALEEAEAAAKAKLLSEPVTVDNAGERLFTRSERQTFVRFPRCTPWLSSDGQGTWPQNWCRRTVAQVCNGCLLCSKCIVS